MFRSLIVFSSNDLGKCLEQIPDRAKGTTTTNVQVGPIYTEQRRPSYDRAIWTWSRDTGSWSSLDRGRSRPCRVVGITRETGYRWRAENGGVPPAGLDEETRSNRYLSLLERQRIATLHGQGLGVREIARRVDRSPSTVSRELRRNVRPHDRNVDDADLAHARVGTCPSYSRRSHVVRRRASTRDSGQT